MRRSGYLLIPLLLLSRTAFADPSPQPPPPGRETGPKTFRLSTIAAVRDKPGGRILDIWDAGTTFTSSRGSGDWIRVTGYFPNGTWEKNRKDIWVHRLYAVERPNRTQAPRPAHPNRYIVVDKSDMRLQVFEQKNGEEQMVFSTPVALGMDRCLPEEQGGRCYFTDPGEYKVRWKVHDPKGIEWCIPSYMEKEYAEDIAAGNRCFRGSIGYYALNIGKSYAIHGTNKPETVGQRVSHGCVRAANDDMETIYTLMDVGAKVLIRE